MDDKPPTTSSEGNLSEDASTLRNIISEQQAIITDLEMRNSELKMRNNDLEMRNTELERKYEHEESEKNRYRFLRDIISSRNIALHQAIINVLPHVREVISDNSENTELSEINSLRVAYDRFNEEYEYASSKEFVP